MADGDNRDTRPTLFNTISLGYVYNSFIALAFLNILLSISATLLNLLIVLALRKESLLHPPSRLLLRCLSFTDLCVGLISQPLAALHAISILTKHLRIYRFTVVSTYITSVILSGVSLFILTFISVDRLLALSLGVRYRQTVTTGRVRAFVIFSWAVTVANGFASFLPGNKFVFYIVCVTGILLCVVISTFCYTKIYYLLCQQGKKVRASGSQQQPSTCPVEFSQFNIERRGHKKTASRTLRFMCFRKNVQHIDVQPIEFQEKSNESCPLHIERYKKTVSSALWVHLTLLACYLPYSIVSGMKATTGETFAVAEGFTATLIFLNSSLNPVLYCWRIREVRQAVKEAIRQYCGFSSEA
ncbi:5-hydroxytryptamine receptor 1B-like [Oculina patagonica]